MTKRLKVLLHILLTVLCFVMVLAPRYTTIYADKDDDKETEKKVTSTLEDAGYDTNVETYISKTEQNYTTIKRDTTDWYIAYLFMPGFYISDVNASETLDSSADNAVSHQVNGRWTVCHFDNEPQNLLNHNCDIPSFGTEAFQNILHPFTKTGLQNHERTSAYLGALQIGRPIHIPNDTVPVNWQEREHEYTALELYGYNLEYVDYLGEYDHIVTLPQARTLANVGFWGKVKLGSSAIFKGASNVFNEFFTGWTFNPTKWNRDKGTFTSGALSVLVDSSDYNVVATHSWSRPYFASTLYNGYYLSDKLIIEKGKLEYLKFLEDNLFKEIGKDPRAQEVLYLMPGGEHYPVFVMDYEQYTPESKEVVQKWEDCRKKEKDKEQCGVRPNLEVVPEEEQFKNWKELPYQIEYDRRAKAQGIGCFTIARKQAELDACWIAPFNNYAKKTIAHDNTVVQLALDNLAQAFFDNKPEYNPAYARSHYICADEEGKPLGDSLAEWKLIYAQENERDREHLTEGCYPVRPSIEGARFGTGDKHSSDTRYQLFLTNTSPKQLSFFGKIGRWIAQVTTKITNTMITLSFSNIVKQLQIDTILETFALAVRDSIFFPLSSLLIVCYGIYLIWQAKDGVNPFSKLAQALIVYVVVIVIFLQLGNILKLVEEVPAKLDNLIIETILPPNNQTKADYCTLTDEGSKLREVQCSLWDITIFRPWLYGQWGVTNPKELDVANMLNKNSTLVGDATVYLSKERTVNNWAIYQLDKTKTDTITSINREIPTGTSSKAMYKLVDLQAGPNHGTLSDTRFIHTWSGQSADRSTPMFYSGIVGILLVTLIGGLALVKLETVFLMLFRILLFSVLSIRALATGSMRIILEEASEFFKLFAKRLVAVFFIGFTLRIVIAVLQTDGPIQYTSTVLFVLAILVALKLYWKQVINLLLETKAQVGNFRQTFAPLNQIVPQYVRMRYNQFKGFVKQAPGNVVGSVTANLTNHKEMHDAGLKNSLWKDIQAGLGLAKRRADAMEYKKARRNGFGLLTQWVEAYQVAEQEGLKKFDNPSFADKSKVDMMYQVLTNRQTEIHAQLEHGSTDKEALDQELQGIELALEQLNYITDGKRAVDVKFWNRSDMDGVNKAVLAIDFDKLEMGLDSNGIPTVQKVSSTKVMNQFIQNIQQAVADYQKQTIADNLLDDLYRKEKELKKEINKQPETNQERRRAVKTLYQEQQERLLDELTGNLVDVLPDAFHEPIKEEYRKVLQYIDKATGRKTIDSVLEDDSRYTDDTIDALLDELKGD